MFTDFVPHFGTLVHNVPEKKHYNRINRMLSRKNRMKIKISGKIKRE